MFRLFFITFFLLFSAPLLWADSVSYSKQIVDTLETKWDEENKLPGQVEDEALKLMRLLEDKDFKLIIHYPQNSGNKAVDELIKKYAEEKKAVFENDVKEFSRANAETKPLKSLTFIAVKPSVNYLSLVFYDYSFMGDSHAYRVYECKTYDLKTGLELSPKDLLTEPEDVEDFRPQQFFINYLNAALDKNCFDEQKETSICLPAGLTVDNINDNLNSIAFTPSGLAFIAGPFEQDSAVDGSKFVDVPKENLLHWGFSDKFWQ